MPALRLPKRDVCYDAYNRSYWCGLSSGAKWGIAWAVIVGVFFVFLVFSAFLYRRRRAILVAVAPPQPQPQPAYPPPLPAYYPAKAGEQPWAAAPPPGPPPPADQQPQYFYPPPPGPPPPAYHYDKAPATTSPAA